MTAFLGVEASLTGRRWVGLNDHIERNALAMSQQTGLPELVARTLARLGVPADQAAQYLAPSLRDLMPDPSSFKDLDTAAARINQGVANRERIAVFADYDVDGGSSAALLVDWFRHFAIDVTLYVPDRIDEGYGPNVPAMEKLAASHNLIICVDCGTLSHEPIAAAKGADVIVLDHHLGGETLPPAMAVVNPNRQDETSDYGYLCAAGVVFLTLVACNSALKKSGTANLPNLLNALDIVALATVADVAPLVGFNRALVRQGLKVMGNRRRAGLVALADVGKLTTAPAAYHLGYVLGPRINAGGRVGKADLGARLLSTIDADEAQSLAEKLDMLNTERRDVELQVQLQAMEQAEQRGTDGALVWAAGNNWHPGVVGIVASRLKEKTNRPAIVIGLNDGVGQGSGRSVSGIDLGNVVATCAREGLLVKGGGHKMAAGMTVEPDKLEAAMARMTELLEKQGAANLGPKDLAVDGAVANTALTPDLIEQLELAGPFGAGAPAPRFVLPAQRVSFAKRAGESHLRITFQGEGGARMDAICFNAYDSEIGIALEKHSGALFHIAGRIEIDTWGGRRRVKMRVEDVARAE